MSSHEPVMLITGTRKGIGRYLAEYYVGKGARVIGISRDPSDFKSNLYEHFCADVSDEPRVREIFFEIRKKYARLDVLINNAACSSTNHSLLTSILTARGILNTNVIGTFLFCREATKIMKKTGGRIVNFGTLATPLRTEGAAIYAASKAAVISLTEILARELADFKITVNAVGPTPLKTDLERAISEDKINRLINNRLAIHRFAEFKDVSNVIDFFIKPESDFITGQVVYLGGVTG